MWQKARIIVVEDKDKKYIGQTIFVKTGPPHNVDKWGRHASDELRFETNLVDATEPNHPYCIRQSSVELLPNFVDDVPMCLFSEWSESLEEKK